MQIARVIWNQGSSNTPILGCLLRHICSHIRPAAAVASNQSQKVCYQTWRHTLIWAVNGLVVSLYQVLRTSPALLSMLVVQRIRKVTGAGSNYRDPGARTFGLFLHVLQGSFGIALPARGKAGRAGRHYIAHAGKK